MKIFYNLMSVVAIGLTATTLACAAPIDDMRKLVEAGQFDVAYKTAQENPDQIGTPHFDFLYGLAAIGAGHVSEGLLALERHLSFVPANDRARLELARGYYLLGEFGRARLEFEFVLKHNPPKEVQDNIRHYLDSIQTRDTSALRATSRFYVDVGYGHDSNVNGGTYNNSIQLLSGSIPISNPSSQAIPDSFRQLTTGGQWSKRVSPQLSVFAGGDVDVRDNQSAGSYNQDTYGVFTGFSYLKGAGLYRVSIADNQMAVGGVGYRDMMSVTGEAQYTLAPGRSVTGFAQYGESGYYGANKVLDSAMTTLGVTFSQAFSGVRFNPSVGLRLSTAVEDNLRMRPDLSRHINSVQLFGGMSPAERIGLNMGLTWQQQDYQGTDLAFGSIRQDKTYSADLGGNYAFNRNWSARLAFQASNNITNQNLYAYTRRGYTMKTRYEF